MSKDEHNVPRRQNTRPTIAYLASETVVGPTPMQL